MAEASPSNAPTSAPQPTTDPAPPSPSSSTPAPTSSAQPTSSDPPPTSSTENPPTSSGGGDGGSTTNPGGGNSGGGEQSSANPGGGGGNNPSPTPSSGGGDNNGGNNGGQPSQGGQQPGSSDGGAQPSSNPDNGGSSNNAGSATPTGSGQSAYTSYKVETSMNAQGSQIIVTQTVIQTGSPGNSTVSGNKDGGGTNVGAIVGGVVGGVCGLALILGIIFLIMRKRKRSYRDDFDDMMFDPARAQNHAPIDLSDTAAPHAIDPYDYQPVQGVAATSTGSPEMSQYYHGGASSSEGYNPAAPSTHATSSTGGYAGLGAGAAGLGAGAAFAGAGAGHSAFPSAAPTGMTAKQQEAWREQQQFHVQNPNEASSSGPVTVHTDGGAYNDLQASGNEIPPTYDSIGDRR